MGDALLTEESPELYYRRGMWYGFTCVADDYQLTQVCFGWHIFYTHIRGEDGEWRRWRERDPLPEEARQAGTCLALTDDGRGWVAASWARSAVPDRPRRPQGQD
jgi:hypothetical protein